MGNHILDLTYKTAAALPAYRVAARGAANAATTIPTGFVVPSQILGVTTHAQPNVGRAVAIRRIGVAEVQAAAAILAGDIVVPDGADGRIRSADYPAGTIDGATPGNALTIAARTLDPALDGYAISLQDSGASSPLQISCGPAATDVILATNGGGSITTTLAALAAALNASPAGALFTFGVSGTGTVLAATGSAVLTGFGEQNPPIGVAQADAIAEDDIIPVLLTL